MKAARTRRIVAFAVLTTAALFKNVYYANNNGHIIFHVGHEGNETQSYCRGRGSLHQIALDMFNQSSPPGSASYNKLKHVLGLNSEFSIDMGGTNAIFSRNEELIAAMLRGYGLRQVSHKLLNQQNVTLVDTWFTRSICPLTSDEKCNNHPRIHIQTEQKFVTWDKITACSNSPNCVILEFSQYNLGKMKERNLLDSCVLLPVMTQVPSRISEFEPKEHKILHNRSIDIVFFGAETTRRKDWINKSRTYLKSQHPNRKVLIKTGVLDYEQMAKAYADAKVCVIVHSYNTISGGEYHRWSEFGPFGCRPVMETFADTVGMRSYEKCGGAIFTNLTNVIPTAIHAAEQIDQRIHQGIHQGQIIDWWNTGIQWEGILPTVFGAEE